MANDSFNLFVSSFVSFSINGLKENAENLNYYRILRRKVELYLFLSTQGERCLSPKFFTLLTCWHVQFSKIFAFLVRENLEVTKQGVANGTSKNVGLGKFWQDLEISEAFLISLEVSFLHGLYLLFLSLETFYQRVSGSDF